MKELEKLITKTKENHGKVYEYPENEKDKYNLEIIVDNNDRHFFYEVILPNLPLGYRVLPIYPIGAYDGFNKFTITQNKHEEQKDKFLIHLNRLQRMVERYRKSIFREFPTISKLNANDYENKKHELFKEEYCVYGYDSISEHKYIDALCEIEVELNSFLFDSEVIVFLNKKFKSLEHKAKNLDDKEIELAKRTEALDLLKKHLDAILIRKNT
jgi:hypothetical protein